MMIHQGASEFGVSVSAKPTRAYGPNSVAPTQHMRKLGVSTREQLLARAATLDLSERDAADIHPE
jgi:hypothetical protein